MIKILAMSLSVLGLLIMAAWIGASMILAWIETAVQFMMGDHESFLYDLDRCVAQGKCDAGDSLEHVMVEHVAYYFIKLFGRTGVYTTIWLSAFWDAFKGMPELVASAIYHRFYPQTITLPTAIP
jgi:hypothetical protein